MFPLVALEVLNRVFTHDDNSIPLSCVVVHMCGSIYGTFSENTALENQLSSVALLVRAFVYSRRASNKFNNFIDHLKLTMRAPSTIQH